MYSNYEQDNLKGSIFVEPSDTGQLWFICFLHIPDFSTTNFIKKALHFHAFSSVRQ